MRPGPSRRFRGVQVEPGPQHINPEHMHDEGWPVRLVSSRCDLKTTSDRRNLCRTFLSHGAPALRVDGAAAFLGAPQL